MSDALFAYKFRSMEVGVDLLPKVGAIDQQLRVNLGNFFGTRNIIIQQSFGDNAEIRRTVDSGLKIYGVLQARFVAPPP